MNLQCLYFVLYGQMERCGDWPVCLMFFVFVLCVCLVVGNKCCGS